MLFSLKNTVFTVFSGIKQIPVVAGWYYQMPFFSNGETQVDRQKLTDGLTYQNQISQMSQQQH